MFPITRRLKGHVAPRAPRRSLLVGLVTAGLLLGAVGSALADPFTIGAESNSWGHVLETPDAECMWMHVHIAKPADQNEFRFRPYIYSRFTMNYAQRVYVAPGDMVNRQCAEWSYRAPPFTMHVAQHLAIWAEWAGTWVWCNNGPELTNGDFQHEMFTSWWWWAYPCQDIASSPETGSAMWFFNHGYYRADISIGTFERRMSTGWLFAG